MSQFRITDDIRHHVRALIEPDLQCAVSDTDLKHRLARNGYGFRDQSARRVLVTLPHGIEVMDLPRKPTMH